MHFLPALALLLITLKILEVITISWLWVLAPIWMPILVFCFLVLLGMRFTNFNRP